MQAMVRLCAAILGETSATIVSLALGALTVTALWRMRRLTAGTTLVAPWWWAVAASISLTVAVIAANREPGQGATYRYLAGAMLLAPSMALLGAKRPQDRAWQWIVASLLVLAALPVGQLWLYRPGSALQVEPAWQGFLLVIALLGIANHLLTMHAFSALLCGAALYALLGEQFPQWTQVMIPQRALVAQLALALAAGWAIRPRSAAGQSSEDRRWLAFRDAYGATWALRLMERFNATARAANWGVTLTWTGFEMDGAQQAEMTLPETAKQSWENLLRRFVSTNWPGEPEA